MIDGNFYTIVARHESDPLHIRCDVEFNVDHEIFKAHFPGNPIVPGVCSLEIIRQMATALLGGVIRIPSVKNMKFINVMTPAKGKLFTFDIFRQGHHLRRRRHSGESQPALRETLTTLKTP